MSASDRIPVLDYRPIGTVAGALAVMIEIDTAHNLEPVLVAREFVNSVAAGFGLDAIVLWSEFMAAPSPCIRNLWDPSDWPVLATDLLGTFAASFEATVH